MLVVLNFKQLPGIRRVFGIIIHIYSDSIPFVIKINSLILSTIGYFVKPYLKDLA